MLVYTVLKHYLPVILCTLSILCIIPTIVILLKNGLCRRLAIYLVTLATVDLLTTVSLMLLSLDQFILPYLTTEQNILTFSAFESIIENVVEVLLLTSNWFTVAVATERYVAICYPLFSRRISPRIRQKIAFGIIVTALLLGIPSFVGLKMNQSYDNSLGTWMLTMFNIWFTRVLLLFLLPCILLLFVNVRLIHALRTSFFFARRSATDRIEVYELSEKASECSHRLNAAAPVTLNEPTGAQRKCATRGERKITTNLICLIVVFFLCQVPFIVISIAYKLFSQSNEYQTTSSSLENNPLDHFSVHTAQETNTTFAMLIDEAEQDNWINAFTIVRAMSTIFLMLKSDLYFLLYCWLSESFADAFTKCLRGR